MPPPICKTDLSSQVKGMLPIAYVAGAAASGANSDITSLSGLSTPLSVAQGGTGRAIPVEFVASDYAFAAQTPGVELTAGVPATVTLSPVPDGVSGTDANHYLYISGGAGVAEAVLITGGTAISGAASGTVTFTPANNHSGAWTIKSATAGIQEAIWAINGTGRIHVPSGSHTIYAPITVIIANSKAIAIAGAGNGATYINRHSSFVAGDVFLVDQAVGTGNALFADFSMENSSGFDVTSGSGIHIKGNTSGYMQISGVVIYHGYKGIDVEDSGNVQILNTSTLTSPSILLANRPLAGLHIHGHSGASVSNSNFQTAEPSHANSLQYGVLIQGSDGTTLSNCNINGLQGLGIVADGTANITHVYVANSVIDSYGYAGVRIGGNNGAKEYFNITFSGTHIGNGAAGAQGVIIDATDADYIAFQGCRIFANGLSGVNVSTVGAQSIQFTGCDLSENNYSNMASISGVMVADMVGGLHLTGNTITNKNIVLVGYQRYGVYFLGAASNCTVTGNNLSGNVTGPMLITGALTSSVIENNTGVDSAIGTVASGASIALPVNPAFTVTGTTGVGAVTGLWEGREVTFITPDGVVDFTAGATIGNSFSTTQNVPVKGVAIGGKLYLR